MHSRAFGGSLLLAFLATCASQGGDDDVGCFVDGECTYSFLVDEWPAEDAQVRNGSCLSCFLAYSK